MSSVLAPIPRSIIKFKPWGGSAYATEVLSPKRWKITRSEVLVTGYGDLIIHFGILGGMLVFGVAAFLWTWALRSVCLEYEDLSVFFFIFLVWAYYIFMRGDAFNLSRHIWFYLIVWAGAWLLVQTRLSIPEVRLGYPADRES